MKEIFQKLNRQPYTEKTEIEFEVNPQNIIGDSITKEHRLLYFDTVQTEPLYIDFVPHNGTTNTIFLIPSGHLLYLPYQITNYNTIIIPHTCLNDIEKYWIYRLKYKNDKSITFTQQLERFAEKNILQDIIDNQTIPNTTVFQYIQQAEHIMLYLFNTNCCHQLSVKEILSRMNITEKTLQRICKTVFELQPTQILRYHLTLKIVFHLINDKQKTNSEIASELNFKDVSTFNRYVKTLTKFTPKEIRETHNHIIL